MKREWKPGDVAMVRCSDGEERSAWCKPTITGADLVWVFADGAHRDVYPEGARPLVVIDPEDAAQIDALCKALVEAMYAAGDRASAARVHPATFKRALRRFANPKPPEPLGLGAVVEDDRGRKFVRVADAIDGWMKDRQWQRIGGDLNAERNFVWDTINAVRVLSEGVTE